VGQARPARLGPRGAPDTRHIKECRKPLLLKPKKKVHNVVQSYFRLTDTNEVHSMKPKKNPTAPPAPDPAADQARQMAYTWW
jgi:hypothetical protein